MATLSLLSNTELLDEAQRLAASESQATAALVRCLIEVEDRGLHLAGGWGSMFVYCTAVLHLCEGAAYNRIHAARMARKYPVILERLGDGSVTLTAIRLLGPHLTADNCDCVLALAKHATKRAIEELIASLDPKPDVPSVIRKLPQTPAPCVAKARTSVEPRLGANEPANCVPVPVAPHVVPSMIQPLAPERYKLQLTIARETHDTLRQLQDLMRHTIPDGDPSRIIDRALTLLLEDVRRQKCGATRFPRVGDVASSGSRDIPAAVRRAVWARDGGRCAFVGTHGRCTETAFLEYHHREPFAVGGKATVENIELRCRAPNAYEAQLFFTGDVARESDVGSFWNELPRLGEYSLTHLPTARAAHTKSLFTVCWLRVALASTRDFSLAKASSWTA
jgi:hypothetical protein